MGDVGTGIALADLELEDVVPAVRQHLLGFGDVARRIATGQRPCHRQTIMLPSTEQLRRREAGTLAECVDERCFDGAFREMVALRHFADRAHGQTDTVRVAGEQDRREIGVDRQLHAFGALGAVGQSADRCAFADTDDPVRHAQTDDHQRLSTHRRHGELVRTDRGKIDQEGLDLLDTDGWLGHWRVAPIGMVER